MRWLAFIVGTLATTYVGVLWILHQTCDTGTCVTVSSWRWIVFGVIGAGGLAYSLGPLSHKRDAAGEHLSLREAMQKPRLPTGLSPVGERDSASDEERTSRRGPSQPE